MLCKCGLKIAINQVKAVKKSRGAPHGQERVQTITFHPVQGTPDCGFSPPPVSATKAHAQRHVHSVWSACARKSISHSARITAGG